MNTNSPEIMAAKRLMEATAQKLRSGQPFHQLSDKSQKDLLKDIRKITSVLGGEQPKATAMRPDPYAFTFDTPDDFYRRRFGGGKTQAPGQQPAETGNKRFPMPATTQLPENAGALMDEIDFPEFVAGLIHGTFDAMVDSAIRQMEAYADLVSAVARNADDFIRDNVTVNQAKDWLIERYPQDLDMSVPPNLVPKGSGLDLESSDNSPAWLADFGLEGETLTQELIDEQLIPIARRRAGDNRLKNLATMVLLGMNRIRVTDGAITARVLFRAAARDRTKLDYAVSSDPGRRSWGTRGSGLYETHATKVSTVGLNAQSTASLRAELFGEVKINFASETLPLERLVGEARLSLLQQNSRNPALGPASTTSPPGSAAEETVAPTEG